MNRREVLQRVAMLMGGAISAPALLGVLNGCTPKPGTHWKPKSFAEAQGEVVAEVAEIMIPRTDTPGARDIGIPQFIDTMLAEAYTSEDRTRYVAGLSELDALAERTHGGKFMAVTSEQRVALVQSIQDEAAAAERKLTLSPAELRRPFILMTRELALLGFFTSEVGATQVLQYDRVPGAFHGCVPLAEAGNGKTWALETSTRF